ncbi:MAG: phosphoglycerate dehydrogenase, partial [Phycisphaerae bacterium]|nr:phosphoglycerate dehydrogenase [Phycisphaerae bacterium]
MPDRIKILVADKLAPKGLDYLRSFDNVDVDTQTGLSEAELASIIGQYHGLLVRSGVQVTDKVLAEPGNLRAIARAGVGVDNIDLEAATAKGVLVMNSAEASTITTAEHAFALLMALARNIGPAYQTMVEGGWDRKKFVGTQLAGKTLGIVGFGRIGRTVAERALAFEMDVVAFDPIYNAPTALDGRVRMHRDFESILPKVDLLSFHVPLNDNTRGMLNARTFAQCRDGVMVVNASRGGVIDIPSLIEALDSGKCAGAAIDVYEDEPPAEDDPLRAHPKVLCTPHLGASTAEAQEAVSTDACAQILEYLRGEGLRGAVNLGGVRMDLDETQQRFADLVKRMARFVAPTCEQGISSISLTLEGQAVAAAAGTFER